VSATVRTPDAAIFARRLQQIQPPDPLHAIDEPATYTSVRTHPLPVVSAGQQADINEVIRGSVRRRVA
jgi:hypothetical protein